MREFVELLEVVLVLVFNCWINGRRCVYISLEIVELNVILFIYCIILEEDKYCKLIFTNN